MQLDHVTVGRWGLIGNQAHVTQFTLEHIQSRKHVAAAIQHQRITLRPYYLRNQHLVPGAHRKKLTAPHTVLILRSH